MWMSVDVQHVPAMAVVGGQPARRGGPAADCSQILFSKSTLHFQYENRSLVVFPIGNEEATAYGLQFSFGNRWLVAFQIGNEHHMDYGAHFLFETQTNDWLWSRKSNERYGGRSGTSAATRFSLLSSTQTLRSAGSGFSLHKRFDCCSYWSLNLNLFLKTLPLICNCFTISCNGPCVLREGNNMRRNVDIEAGKMGLLRHKNILMKMTIFMRGKYVHMVTHMLSLSFLAFFALFRDTLSALQNVVVWVCGKRFTRRWKQFRKKNFVSKHSCISLSFGIEGLM